MSLNIKLLRAMKVAGITCNANTAWIFKLIYEFWGFCVNGTDDLRSPGGVARVSGYLSASAGFESGSTVLLASGSDGQTTLGMPVFSLASSSVFSASHVGKWLVTWKSGSASTDDSIYPIIKYNNPSSIEVDTFTGGTPAGHDSPPSMTDRTGINYRVVDVAAAATLPGIVDGSYMVLQCDSAQDVNPGQAMSQFKLTIRYDSYYGTYSIITLQLSPSGSWNGSTFVGESYPESTYQTQPQYGFDLFQSVQGEGRVTLLSDRCFLIMQSSGPYNNWNGNLFQVEIPTRLYPQANDPNPICGILMMGNKNLPIYDPISGRGYYMNQWMFPSPYDATVRVWRVLAKTPTGSYPSDWRCGGSIYNINTWRWPNTFYNPILNKFLTSDTVLCLGGVPGQFSLARARLRSLRMISSGYPRFLRVGDPGDYWIHVGNGVLWPWDNALVHHHLMFWGF